MNRTIRGMAGLLVALGASACADDWSLDFGGEPSKIQASPSVMFVNQGASKELLVRLVNDRNQSVPASFTISNVGAGISVTHDDDYRPDWINSDRTLTPDELQVQHRYFVSATSPVGTSFTISSGGISQVIQVRVIPTSLPLTLAGGNGTTEPTAITNDNFLFTSSTTFSIDGVQLPFLSISEDGHTANVILPAGLTDATLTITGARASYMPAVGLPALPAAETISTPAGSPIAGTATVGSAPNITVPADGQFGFVDIGPFTGADILGAGGPIKWYLLTVPADRGETDISVIWNAGGGADIDAFLIDGAFTTFLGQAANGNNADHPPETITFNLVAGTYYLAVVNWSNIATPSFVSVVISDH